jgi:hypothetical protein
MFQESSLISIYSQKYELYRYSWKRVFQSTIELKKNIGNLKTNILGPSRLLLLLLLLWIDKTRSKDKTYMWVLVWWKTTN